MLPDPKSIPLRRDDALAQGIDFILTPIRNFPKKSQRSTPRIRFQLILSQGFKPSGTLPSQETHSIQREALFLLLLADVDFELLRLRFRIACRSRNALPLHGHENLVAGLIEPYPAIPDRFHNYSERLATSLHR